VCLSLVGFSVVGFSVVGFSVVRLSLVRLTRCRACHRSRHVPIAPRPPHWISHITIRLAGLYRRQ